MKTQNLMMKGFFLYFCQKNKVLTKETSFLEINLHFFLEMGFSSFASVCVGFVCPWDFSVSL